VTFKGHLTLSLPRKFLKLSVTAEFFKGFSAELGTEHKSTKKYFLAIILQKNAHTAVKHTHCTVCMGGTMQYNR